MNDIKRPATGLVIIWHTIVVALLLTLPMVKLGVPIWRLSSIEFLPFMLLLGCYVASALISVVLGLRSESQSLASLVGTIATIFGVLFLYLLVRKADSSRVAMVVVFAAAVVAVPLALRLGRFLAPGLIVLAIAATIFLGIVLFKPNALVPKAKAVATSTLIKTGFYNLRANYYRDYFPAPAVRGGGMSRIGDRVLLATGDGHMYLLGFGGLDRDKYQAQLLPYRVPINGDEFAMDTTGRPWHRPGPNEPLALAGEDAGNTVITWWFRVTSILVQDLGDQVRVFSTHYFWKRDQSCWVERVSAADSARDPFMAGRATLNWRTVYETQPCLPIKGEGRRRGTPFAGHFGGGRLALRDPQTLILSVGDFGFNGLASKQMLSQDPKADYGKIIEIHLQDGTSNIYSTGIRNPQGLYIDPKSTIWETEHGPQGGDELNLIKKDANYGWPFVTYGTDYGTFKWPLNPQQGEHNGFEAPFYAWLPSIGVSDLTGVEKNLFPVWNGDLLVSSLAGKRVFRVRIRNQRVAYAEPILIDMRIRDIVEAADGTIVLWGDDDNTIVTLRPLYGSSGEVMFATSCSGCHKVGDGTSHRIGPDLWGVIGRPVASADGYVDYSAALRAYGGKWTEERLNAFITSPQSVVPGSAMEIDGVKDPETRRKIIDYIRNAPEVISR